MSRIIFENSTRKYPVIIENNFDEIIKFINRNSYNSKAAVITDINVGKIYVKEFVDVLSQCYESSNIFVFTISNGDHSKNLKTITMIYEFLLSNNFERSDTIFALGGGVVGDIAGFAASTYLRGITLIQVPTSLLAQVDSSIGGKVGVNYGDIKNVVGSFYQPSLVYINVKAINTLNKKEMRNGLAEMIVHALILKPEMLTCIKQQYNEIIVKRDYYILEQLIYDNVKLKLSVIEKDEKENGIRQILNFGHTVGHAVEEFFKYNYTHGECVSIGIIAAFKVAYQRNLISFWYVKYIIFYLNFIGLPIYMENIIWKNVLQNLYFDKKMNDGKLIMILPVDIGKVTKCEIKIDDSLLKIISNTKCEEELMLKLLY